MEGESIKCLFLSGVAGLSTIAVPPRPGSYTVRPATRGVCLFNPGGVQGLHAGDPKWTYFTHCLEGGRDFEGILPMEIGSLVEIRVGYSEGSDAP